MIQDVFSVLADPTRRAILEALRDGECPVGDLVDEVGVSQPTVSKHLRILREAAMVEQRAEGQKRFYTLRAEGLTPALQWLSALNTTVPSATTVTKTVPADVPVTLPPRTDAALEEQARAEHGAGPVQVTPPAVSADVAVDPDTGGTRGGFLSAVFRRRRR